MLTGHKRFVGEDVSDTLALVLKFDSDWTSLPAETPTSIRRLLQRLLTRETKFRIRKARSTIVEIRESEIEAGLAGRARLSSTLTLMTCGCCRSMATPCGLWR